MLGDFDSNEFIELADDLFQDGEDAVLYRQGSAKFNPRTLEAPKAPTPSTPFKVVWVAPQQSTTIRFDKELDSEDFVEHRVASINYRGDIDTMDRMTVAGVQYTVTAIAKTAPLGPVIVQRVKLSR